MQRYILIRLLQSVLALVGVSIIVFTLVRLSGNPLDLINDEEQPQLHDYYAHTWGLDKPYYQQYFIFLENTVQGKFGLSFRWPGRTAGDLIVERLPASLQLGSVIFLFGICIGIPMGVLSAVKRAVSSIRLARRWLSAGWPLRRSGSPLS